MRRLLGLALSLGLATAALSPMGSTALAQPAAAQAAAKAAIAAAIADPARPAADTARDAVRKPAETLGLSGVRPGMKVIEFFPGGGYYTRLLAKAVGPTGHVYAINPDLPAPRPGGPPSPLPALAASLGNVTIIDGPLLAAVVPEKVDLVWTSENYHDIRIPMFGSISITAFNKKMFDALKPGGFFYIEDHAAAAGAGATVTNTLHRIDPATVEQEVTAAGFRLQIKSDVLAAPADPHTAVIFDPSIRGKTDKFIMRFVKPR